MKTYKTNSVNYRLVKEKTDIPKVQIKKSADINEYVRQYYHEDIEIYESMFMVLLSRSNMTDGYVKISQGGTAGTVIDIKLICKYALDSLCHGIILVHNHPSGNLNPSEADQKATEKVKNALNILDITLLDHIIIIPETDKYYSFMDNGNM